MNQLEKLIYNASNIESKLGYHFQDRSLLLLAFVHCSFINENKDVQEHNERLEFLGDSVLGMVISNFLYRNYPDTPEGDLSSMRSKLVEANSCITYMKKLDVSNYILLGKGEKMNDGRGRDSIISNLFEAIVGAIFLDGGIAATENFLFDHFREEMDLLLKNPIRNWKALLQDVCQKKFQKTPEYKVTQEIGPEHSKQFQISVCVGQQELGQGQGSSKKEAQQAAAAAALRYLQVQQSNG